MPVHPRVFFLDENIPKKVLSTLRNAGYPATRVFDKKLRGQPDIAIFTHARAHQMAIITFDTDYLNRARFPSPHAGILVLRFFPRETSVTEIASAVLNAAIELEARDISNSIYTIDPDGVNEEG